MWSLLRQPMLHIVDTHKAACKVGGKIGGRASGLFSQKQMPETAALSDAALTIAHLDHVDHEPRRC